MNHQPIKPQVMAWIDKLPGVKGTDLQVRRDGIEQLARQAADATHQAQILLNQAARFRERANQEAISLEMDVKGRYSADAVERAKTLAYSR